MHPRLEEAQSNLTGSFQPVEERLWLFLVLQGLAYYAVAVVLFSYTTEDWPIVDSLYYASVIFTTIGFGDLSPTNTYSRIATLILAGYGIIVLGILLGLLGESLLEAKQKEKESRRIELQKGMVQSLGEGSERTHETASYQHSADAGPSSSSKNIFWSAMSRTVAVEGPIIALVIVGALGIGHVEGWDLVQSLYWLGITGATIGFGDLSPTTKAARLACCLFLPLVVAVTGKLMGRVASAYLDRNRKQVESEFLSRTMTICDLEIMDADKDGTLSRAEVRRIFHSEIGHSSGVFSTTHVALVFGLHASGYAKGGSARCTRPQSAI
jgi:potassium channel subfamily K, other eukaryote